MNDNATKAMGLLKSITGGMKITTTIMITKSFVFPIIEYGLCVKTKALPLTKPFEHTQKKALGKESTRKL